MALRVWLPLNGNTNNQGISGAAVTDSGGTFQTPGKTAASCWYSSGKITVPWAYKDTNRLSISIWLKPNTANAWTSIFGWGATSIANRIEVGDTAPYYWFFGTNGLMASNTILTTSMTDQVWHHFAMVADGTNVRFYLDGALIKTATQSITVAASFGDTNTISFGGYQDQFRGYYNDVRVYDHALSSREVHELAQGMVIHYPMCSAYGSGRANFYSGLTAHGRSTDSSFTVTKLLNEDGYNFKLTRTGTGSSSWPQMRYPGISRTLITPGKKYVWSAKVRCNKWTSGSLGFRNAICANDYTHGSTEVCKSSLADGQWHQYTRTYTITEGLNNGTTYYYITDEAYNASTQASKAYIAPRVEFCSSDQKTEGTVYDMDFDVKEVQLIEADAFPGWTDGAMSSSTVADCSGHGNDGTVSSVPPTMVSGSPRNSLAWKFNAGTYVTYKVPVAMPQMTWSAWVNTTGISTYTAMDIKTGDPAGSYWLGVNTESSGLWLYRSNLYNKTNATLTGWHHLALTYNAGITRWYLDGTAVGSEVDMSSKDTAWPAITRTIGDSYTGSNWSGTPFLGSMSDFRVFATVLSAADIKALYNAPIRVTNAGGLHSDGEITEGYMAQQFRKTGDIRCSGVSEVIAHFDNTVYFEPDGSTWLRVVHHADPTTYKFASGDTFATHVWKDGRRWFCGEVMNWVDKWEFMVIQRADSSASTYKYRWSQTVNPNTAVYEDVPSSAVTKNTSTGYTSYSTGGIYKFNSSAYYVTNNGSKGNWWGAIGAWNAHQGGIPGWAGTVVKDGGFLDLYLRVDNVTWAGTAPGKVSLDRADNGIVLRQAVER